MAHIHHWFLDKQFDLPPGRSATQFWDIPNNLWFTPATWTVTPYPETALDPPYPAEQRVEITNVFLLRKGPDVAPPDRRGLQLNYLVHNRGTHPAKGGIVISAVTA